MPQRKPRHSDRQSELVLTLDVTSTGASNLLTPLVQAIVASVQEKHKFIVTRQETHVIRNGPSSSATVLVVLESPDPLV